MRTPDTCPNCGADLPSKAKVCPECGSDEKTGWSEQADLGGLDLPDESFDYDDYVKREFGGEVPRHRDLHWIWWVVAVLLLGGFGFTFWKVF